MHVPYLTLVAALSLSVVRPAGAQDSTLQYGDSTTFDLDGYYVPATVLAVRGAKVRHFEIRTLEYYYDGSLHYDRPRILAPRAYVVLASGSASTRHDCRLTSASRDGFRIACERTPIGELHLEAAFLDRRGRYWNIDDYEIEERVVARGLVLVGGTGAPDQSIPIELVYTTGH